MVNKLLIGSALAAAILFTGCSQKASVVDTSTQTTAPAPSPIPETATSSQPSVSSESATTSAPVAVEVDPVAEAQAKIQSILFDFDKFNIRADMQPIVDANAKLLSSVTAKVKLEGNADERGSDEYNYALGLKRANTVKAAYVSKGVKEELISTVSFGEGNPVCKESNEECWAKNRRVDTKLEK